MTSYRKTMREAREEMLAINEAKYDLYHKDFSSAMQHAYKMAKKLHGITVDPKEIDDKVASGPKKPSEGKTNSYRLEGDKGSIQVQVYNKGGSKPFELNMYKEEVELDEVGGSAFGGTIDKIQKVVDDKQATKIDGVMVDTFTASLIMKIWNGVSKQNQDKMRKMKVTQLVKAAYKLAGMKEEVELDEDIGALIFGGGIIAALLPVLFMAVREIIRGTPLESSIKNVVDKLKKNKNYKMSDSEKSDVKGFVSKVKKEKPSLLQKVMKQAKLNLLKDEVDLDEGKMSQLHQHIKDGKSAKEIAKIMKLDVKTIQSLMDEKIVESELDENLDGRTKSYKQHRERLESLRVKRQEARDIDPADIDTSATDDDIKSADKNILMQLRKSVSLRGQHPVEFLDKKKIKIPQKIAQAALTKYSSLKKPMDKEKFQSKIAKSHRDLLMALKESNEKMGTFDEVKNLMRKFRENNNG